MAEELSTPTNKTTDKLIFNYTSGEATKNIEITHQTLNEVWEFFRNKKGPDTNRGDSNNVPIQQATEVDPDESSATAGEKPAPPPAGDNPEEEKLEHVDITMNYISPGESLDIHEVNSVMTIKAIFDKELETNPIIDILHEDPDAEQKNISPKSSNNNEYEYEFIPLKPGIHSVQFKEIKGKDDKVLLPRFKLSNDQFEVMGDDEEPIIPTVLTDRLEPITGMLADLKERYGKAKTNMDNLGDLSGNEAQKMWEEANNLLINVNDKLSLVDNTVENANKMILQKDVNKAETFVTDAERFMNDAKRFMDEAEAAVNDVEAAVEAKQKAEAAVKLQNLMRSRTAKAEVKAKAEEAAKAKLTKATADLTKADEEEKKARLKHRLAEKAEKKAKAIAEADNATEDQKQEATVAQAAAAEAAADLNNATDALSKAKEEAEAARAAHGVIPQGGSRQFSFKNKKKKGGRRKRGRHGYSLKRKGSKKKSRRDSRRK